MRLISVLLLAVLAGSLQGCFPVVAAGVGGGALMAEDRRTSGAYIEDEAIENKALNRISIKFKDTVHVNVTSFNRNVLISGEVPDEATRAEIGKILLAVENVRNVNNELAVSGHSSLTSRGSDALVTSNVKLRFVQADRFRANHVKVITERGKVYLMGIVTRAEADAATEIARGTGGVMQVVRLFEYMD